MRCGSKLEVDLRRRPSLPSALDPLRQRLIVMCQLNADAVLEFLDAEPSRIGNRQQFITVGHDDAGVDTAARADQELGRLGTETVGRELIGRDSDDHRHCPEPEASGPAHSHLAADARTRLTGAEKQTRQTSMVLTRPEGGSKQLRYYKKPMTKDLDNGSSSTASAITGRYERAAPHSRSFVAPKNFRLQLDWGQHNITFRRLVFGTAKSYAQVN